MEKKNSFCGNFSGKYNTTTIVNGTINSYKGLATLTIKEVDNGAFLIVVTLDNITTYTSLGYLENNNILRAEDESGDGINSTYFQNDILIHQFSTRPYANTLIVGNFKFKRC